jgi:hypothetical protein
MALSRQQQREMFRRLNDKAKMSVVLERIEDKALIIKNNSKLERNRKFAIITLVSLMTLFALIYATK